MWKTNLQNLGIDTLLCDLEQRLKNIYVDKLKEILLYGSYARGDNKEDSDVDKI